MSSTLNKNSNFFRKAIFICVALFLLTSYALIVFAVPPPPGGYTPGSTLNPSCAPGDVDCIVVAPGAYTFSSPLSETGHVVTLPAADGITDGYLAASDWLLFNSKQDSFGLGTIGQYLRGDSTWQTLDTSTVPENGNLYWTTGRFNTSLATATSAPNLAAIGTVTSGIWHGSQITDEYISDSITASNYIPLTQKGAANGVATLDGFGKVPISQLSSFSLSDTFVVNSEAEMLALSSAELGDVAIRLDENKSYILTTNDPTNVSNWQEIITPLNTVLAVNGQTGAVNLTTSNIPEGTNLYYTDSRVDDYINTIKGVSNGVASLDANGKVPTSQLGSIILNETHVVTDISAMLAITGASNGDLAVVTSTSQTFVLADDNDPTNINSWIEIVNGSPVTSVNGQVGTVNLTTTNITEGSNKYFTDARARAALSATGPLIYNSTTGVFGITAANTITNGYLSAVDWNTFNNKQNALTFGNITANNNSEITITGGTGSVIGGGVDISIPDASDTVRGLITTTAQNFAGIKTFTDNVGIGDSSPSQLFSVGSGGLFQVDSSGDLVKIKNLSYTWPSTQGATGSVLVNTDGAGTLDWQSNGLTSMNGLTDATQTFATSTTGTNFTITSSGGVHTFNIPTSSATNRGLLAATDYSTFTRKPTVDATYNNIATPAIGSGVAVNGAIGGSNNITLGYQAGDTLTSGNNNIMLGYQSGKGVTTGVSRSTFLGEKAGSGATGASFANFFGRNTGLSATGASYANFIGDNAGNNATGAQDSVFIGNSAGYTASSAPYSVFIGNSAGYNAVSASYSNFSGLSAGYNATAANNSNFFGQFAGSTATNAANSNFFGYRAGQGSTNGSFSTFIGYQSGYGATNATNSIFIGKNAGLSDTVNNTLSGSSILIGESTSTGGYQNSIAIGTNAVNTAANQLLIGSSYTQINLRGINYTLPTANATGALTNNGSGVLSWSSNLSIGGTNGQLQYNNSGSLGGVTGVTFDGTNFDASDSVLRLSDNSDSTKRAMFEVSGIDTGTTRTYTFPNAAGTLALASIGTSGADANYSNGTLNLPTADGTNRGLLSNADWVTFNSKEFALTFGTGLTRATNSITNNLSMGISGGQSVIGGTAASENLTLSSTSNVTKGKILFGTSTYNESNNRLGLRTTTPGSGAIYIQAGAGEVEDGITWSNGARIGYFSAAYPTIEAITGGSLMFKSKSTYGIRFADNSGNQAFGFAMIDQTNTTNQALLFGGDYGGAYRSVGTTVAGIDRNGSTLSFFANSGLTGGYASFTPNKILSIDGANSRVGIGTTTPSTALEIANGGTLKLGGGTASGQGNILMNSNASATYDTNVTYLGNNSQTMGMIASSTPAFDSAYGPSIFLRGNSYGVISGQRGIAGLIAGNPSSPTAGEGELRFLTGSNALRMVIGYNGNVGIGQSSPTAVLHLKAGTATANTAPLKFTSGTNLTTAEAGAFEYDGTELFFTPSGTLRSTILMTGLTGYNTYSKVSKGATSFTSGTNNFLVGNLAGSGLTYGSDNNFFGNQAGSGSDASNSNFLGSFAGSGATGATASNFFGQQAGQSATGAVYSNFFGNLAGNSASSASYSNFLGYAAGYIATNASNSNFFGNGAGNTAIGASHSFFAGNNAGRNARAATESIFIGKESGYNSVGTGIQGSYNIGLGTDTAKALTTGAGNTFIGYKVGDTVTTGSKNIAIGYNLDLASNTTDGQMTIGNLLFGTGIDGTGTTVSTGKIGIGTASPSYRFSVSDTTTAGIVGSFTNSDGTCTLDPGDVSGWSCPSDLNLKKDIETLATGSLDNILALRPVTYRLKNEDGSANLSTGLIAQEVQTIFPTLVKTQIDGTLALNYGGLTPYMISAIQEMNIKITDLQNLTPGSTTDTFFVSLSSWLGDMGNGIQQIFSKKVVTEQLCVKDETGQTCITRSQLNALLSGQGTQIQPPSDPTSDPDPITCTAPEVLNSDGTACETPSSSDPAPTPESDPVPPSDNSDPGTGE